ncbi:MAG: Ppx/GppA phosphatase family protein [Alphaproteobacteria bacterium]
MNRTYAAIDLGSNSCRLTIVDKTGKELFFSGVPVRLGEGISETKKISDAAIARAVECFFHFRQEMDAHGVENYRAVATAAMRNAENAQKLIDIVQKESNIKIDIIDGEEEARLTLLGAVVNAEKTKKYVLAFDSGGGSTEISLATNEDIPEIIHSVSIPWGGRNGSEHFDLVEYSEEKADKFRAEIRKYIQKFMSDCHFEKYSCSISYIGASSTPLRLAAAFHDFGKYERGNSDKKEIEISKVDALLNSFYQKSVSELAVSPYVGKNRSPIFVSACLIFETIVKAFEMDKVIASLGSVKEGVLKELIS